MKPARITFSAALLAAILLAAPIGAAGQTAPNDPAALMDAYLAAAHKIGRFSGSVLVAHKGQVVLSKGYGMANYELDVPNTPETKFRLGSVTKQFTAMVILQLEERGKIRVTDTVKSFFPDYPQGENITLHHLLTHTSGVPNLTDFPEYTKTQMLYTPALKSVDKFKSLPLEFEPGEKFSYSNSGYILLGAVIEKATGRPYEDVLRELVLEPAGMKDTGYDHAELVIKNRASGYEFPGDKLANAPYIDMSIPHAAGALYSTTLDLYKWDRALYTDTLLPEAARTRMFTPCKSGYAYGWFIGEFAKHKVIRHGGGIDGFTSDITRFPDDDACVIVLNNYKSGFTSAISNAMAGYLFGQPVEFPKAKTVVKVPAAALDALVGDYKLADAPVVFTIRREGDGLTVQVQGQPAAPLYAESETKFFMKTVGFELSFVKDASGRVTHFVLVQGGREMKADKVK